MAPFVHPTLPVRPSAYFRLLTPPPLEVVFPSVRYVLAFESVPMAGRHQLMAQDPERGRWWMVGPWYHGREFLETAVFEVGVPVMPATVAEVIMRRLQRDGQAELVAAPADDLTARRPAERQPLGSWLRACAPSA